MTTDALQKSKWALSERYMKLIMHEGFFISPLHFYD